MQQPPRSTADRVEHLEAAYTRFRRDQPELARALDVLGLSIEEYERGIAGVATGPRVYVTTSTRTIEDPSEVDPR